MPTNLDPDPELMRIFDFTADDLAANRAKRMSERQAQQLKADGDADRFAVNFAFIISVLVAGILFFSIVLQPERLLSSDGIPTIVVIAGVLIWLYLRYRSNQRSINADLQVRYVGKVEGVATWNVVIRRKEYRYQITVDCKVFRIEKRTYKAFETFMQYKNKYAIFCIYFAPETARILSMEVVSS